MSTPNKILELDKEHLREIDGVVLDEDSYARHAAPPEAPAPSAPALPTEEAPEPAAPQAEEVPSAAPAPVFVVDPVHVGWYQPAEPEAVSYPIMAGAMAPTEAAVQMPVMYFSGSGSGSYLSSYLTSFSTSFLTSWMTSYRYGSGSWITSWLYGSGWMYGSGSMHSSAGLPGGFGLELI